VSEAETTAMPMIQLGEHQVSRLILGSNPMLGYSYMGSLMAKFMVEYYTPENIQKLLHRCLDLGVNTWQTSADAKVDQAFDTLRDSGRDMHWVFLASGEHVENPKALADLVARKRPIAIVHHGGVSDRLYREGRLGEAYDFAERVQDMGILGGISAHNPAVIRHAEESGWDLDLYMTCFYRITRTPAEEAEVVGGEVPLWGKFVPGDPARMCEVVRQVKRPCLGFKIMAGGRLGDRPESVEGAFKFAFENIKPSDGVVVGMFPRFADEPEQNAVLTRWFGSLGG